MPRWTFDEDPIGIAGPALSHIFDQIEDRVELQIGNTAIDGGSLTIHTIQVGVVGALFPIEELTWEGLEGVDWQEELTDVGLGLDDWIQFPPLFMPPEGAVVYRVNAVWYDEDPENYVGYVGQFPEPASLGLLGVGALLLLRRRTES